MTSKTWCNSKTYANKLTSCVLLASFVVLSVIYNFAWNDFENKRTSTTILTTAAERKNGPASDDCFVALNSDKVYSFKNVCIERLHDDVNSSLLTVPGFIPFTENKQIVIYDRQATKLFGKGVRTVAVAGSPNSFWNHWTVKFLDDPIPSTHTFSDVAAAYFVAPTCPANFHHFWSDQFVPLWSVVSRTGRLKHQLRHAANDTGSTCRGRLNTIIYRLPYHQIEPTAMNCFSVVRFEPILQTLGIERLHEVFWKKAVNTCYSHAVFGTTWGPGGGTERDIIDDVVDKLISNNTVSSRRYVTLLQRRQRRFLNIDAMLNAAKNVFGSDRVRVVDFEHLTVVEQLRVIFETCVLVGAHGAGLQWAIFMVAMYNAIEDTDYIQPTLIEISWPQLYWNFFYSEMAKVYGIDYVPLNVSSQNVRVNWTSYEQQCRGGQVVNATERQYMLSSNYRPPNIADNLWKWADVNVDIDQLSRVLKGTDCARHISEGDVIKD